MARNAITSVPFAIVDPGSYFLVTNLTGVAGQNGITISSGDVTLDLNGFLLTGVVGSLDGIRANGAFENISVLNGTVIEWGSDGIDLASTRNSVIVDIRADANAQQGIRAGTGCTVRNCMARANQGVNGGITAEAGSQVVGCIATANATAGVKVGSHCLVRDCTVSDNMENGIWAGSDSVVRNCVSGDNMLNGILVGDGCTVHDCSAGGNGADGIGTGIGCVVSSCSASSSGDDGIVTGAGSVVTDCTAKSSTGDGIEVSLDCRVTGNVCDNSGLNAGDGAGVHATGDDNQITGNHLSDADRGLDIDGSRNLVADNVVLGNTDNYSIAVGNNLRLLLSEIPERIERPAVVELAGTLTGTNGITVAANHVTIDLNGHSLLGAPGNAGDGIAAALSFLTDLTVRNGRIESWGGDGIGFTDIERCVVEDIVVYSNGWPAGAHRGISVGNNSRVTGCSVIRCREHGIVVGNRSIIGDCSAVSNTVDGVRAGTDSTVSSCLSAYNGNDGFETGDQCVISECTSVGNITDGFRTGAETTIASCDALDNGQVGISATANTTVRSCTAKRCFTGVSTDHGCDIADSEASFNSQYGFYLGSNCTIRASVAADNTAASGISVGARSTVVECTANRNGVAGIQANTSLVRIDGNTVNSNGIGINATFFPQVIVRNYASFNATNYNVSAGTPISVIGAGWDGSADELHPWTNFAY